jgi:magnesium chelatase family protein
VTLARLISRGQSGLEAYEVSVEVHLAGGLPGFAITGLPTAAVRESKDRVRAALQTCGFPIPAQRVTVHLGPADVPKDGGRFDLPIALGVIKASQHCDWDIDATEFVGELTLGGALRPVNGVVPAALASRDAGRRLIVPQDNADEASLIADAHVHGARHLLDVLADLNGANALPRVAVRPPPAAPPRAGADLSDVRGQTIAKRALGIAAAGGHNLLMVGPPGSGKSMLAERLRGLLPPLAEPEMLCVASIASVAGDRFAWSRGAEPPFRAPHHTTSARALVGGGGRPRPGEVSLAHQGVLFLDELPEFSRTALEALREPIETGVVEISRLHERIAFPAQFQLLAAMNPCPCGHLGDGTDRCCCSLGRIQAYRARVSGPLLDRFDMHIEVPTVPFDELAAPPSGGESAAVRADVAAARHRQTERRGALNARLDDAALWRCVNLAPGARTLLQRAVDHWQLSARSAVRILRVSRTIADLASANGVEAVHLAEALQLRCLDRPL